MAYYSHSHKADKIARKDLYRLNGISYEEMLENLTVLLTGDHHVGTSTIANLPTNKDFMKSLGSMDIVMKESDLNCRLKVNNLCVVAWVNTKSVYEWFIGYIKDIDDNECYIIDHLHRVLNDSNAKWKYPSRGDVQVVQLSQIVDCDVIGQWDISPDCSKRHFTLTNVKTVCGAFKKYVES